MAVGGRESLRFKNGTSVQKLDKCNFAEALGSLVGSLLSTT
jgi:hypothetical protein